MSHFMLNAYWKPLEFELPAPAAGTGWQRLIDTALNSPLDISDASRASLVETSSYLVQEHSVVVLSSNIQANAGLGSWRNL